MNYDNYLFLFGSLLQEVMQFFDVTSDSLFDICIYVTKYTLSLMENKDIHEILIITHERYRGLNK